MPTVGTPSRRSRAPAPPAWWRETLLVVVVYSTYTLTRNLIPTRVGLARHNADRLLALEKWLGVDVEHGLNQAFAASSVHWLAVAANYTYSVAHFGVTGGLLIWLYLRRPSTYRAARSILLLTTVLGLLGYWLMPLAPPRFFPGLGFVDTVVRDNTWASWASPTVVSVSNQYAAMPSMHAAWSVWSAAVLICCARGRWTRRLAMVYPTLICLVIVGTANHWVLDIVAGMAALGLASAAYVLYRSRTRLREARSTTSTTSSSLVCEKSR